MLRSFFCGGDCVFLAKQTISLYVNCIKKKSIFAPSYKNYYDERTYSKEH